MANANHRLSIILVTHRLERIPSCFSRFLALKSGRVIFGGKLKDGSVDGLAQHLYGGNESDWLPAIPDEKTDVRPELDIPVLIEMKM